MQDNIRYYVSRMAEEERLARAAPWPEAAEVHKQAAKLYRAQVDLLMHRQGAGRLNSDCEAGGPAAAL